MVRSHDHQIIFTSGFSRFYLRPITDLKLNKSDVKNIWRKLQSNKKVTVRPDVAQRLKEAVSSRVDTLWPGHVIIIIVNTSQVL